MVVILTPIVFHGGWNPRVIPWANPLLLGGGVYFRQVDGLETERDFYFQKLRDIEIMCQVSCWCGDGVGSLRKVRCCTGFFFKKFVWKTKGSFQKGWEAMKNDKIKISKNWNQIGIK